MHLSLEEGCVLQTSTSSGETGVGATRNSLETKESLIWLEDITKSMGGRERSKIINPYMGQPSGKSRIEISRYNALCLDNPTTGQ